MKITVPVEDITKKLTLRTHIGSGSYGDVPVELSSAIPTASPIVTVDGQMFLVSINDIAKAIVKQVLEG